MKAKHAVFFIALGYCFDFIAGWLKIVHTGGAREVLLAALLLKLGGVVLLAWKIVRYPGFRKFLDS